jgi:3-oxoacyl-[acyl-carrier-protein] synthase II
MAHSSYIKSTKTIRRVVVTGVGAITPLGNSAEETWQNALKGVSGVGAITRFDASTYSTRIAGEVKNFNPDEFIERKEQKKMDRFIWYAIAAAKMAMKDANLTVSNELSPRAGVLIGTGIGGMPFIEETFAKLMEKGPGRVSPFFIPAVINNLASGWVSILFNCKGPNYSITSACASGAHSIGEAARYIGLGDCDVVLAGGTESCVCPLAVAGFSNMRALSERNDDPTKASRPWDQGRDGFVLAEGAAVYVLEEYEHAVKRGARILCELAGYGASSDANHITTPAPEGAGGYLAMNSAVRDAGIQASQIDYINAHGTSTPVGDGLETMAIKKLMGDSSKKVLVSSTKSMMGHALGAAGAIESLFCIYALRDQAVPPTINLENPSEDCDLDYVANTARKANISFALNNSFGFGGTNASLLFAKI